MIFLRENGKRSAWLRENEKISAWLRENEEKISNLTLADEKKMPLRKISCHYLFTELDFWKLIRNDFLNWGPNINGGGAYDPKRCWKTDSFSSRMFPKIASKGIFKILLQKKEEWQKKGDCLILFWMGRETNLSTVTFFAYLLNKMLNVAFLFFKFIWPLRQKHTWTALAYLRRDMTCLLRNDDAMMRSWWRPDGCITKTTCLIRFG